MSQTPLRKEPMETALLSNTERLEEFWKRNGGESDTLGLSFYSFSPDPKAPPEGGTVLALHPPLLAAHLLGYLRRGEVSAREGGPLFFALEGKEPPQGGLNYSRISRWVLQQLPLQIPLEGTVDRALGAHWETLFAPVADIRPLSLVVAWNGPLLVKEILRPLLAARLPGSAPWLDLDPQQLQGRLFGHLQDFLEECSLTAGVAFGTDLEDSFGDLVECMSLRHRAGPVSRQLCL